jgi:hypothetical protein
LGPWLLLAPALPAAAQVAPLNGQTLLFNQASNVHPGNYLAVDAGLIYTNNAIFATNPLPDTLALVGLSGHTSGGAELLDYHLTTDIAVAKYLRGTFDTRPIGYLDGSAQLRIVPGFFSWIARETFSQVQINPFTAATPDNLVNLNYITTGPRFTLRPTLRTTVTLEGLYSYVSSSSQSSTFANFDNQRYGGNLKIDRAFSETSSLYLTGSYEKVDFRNQTDNNNFTEADATAGYQLTDGRTRFNVSGGYTKLQVENVPVLVDSSIGVIERRETRTFDGPSWGVSLSRLISPTQRVYLDASQTFQDAATAFRLTFDQPVITVAPTQIAAGDPFENRQVNVGWRVELPRTMFDVNFGAARQRYLVDTSNNRDLKLASAWGQRQLSPTLYWDIGVLYSHQDFPEPQQTQESSTKQTDVITNLRWQAGARLMVRFLYAHTTFNGIGVNQLGVIAYYALTAAEPGTAQPALAPTSPLSTQAPRR